MAKPREYIGPGGALDPDDLPEYERSGQYAAEEKRDGCWALLETDRQGFVSCLTSRTGLVFRDAHVEGLLGLQTHLGGVKLMGELETSSQEATKLFKRHGFRRFHAFDVVAPGDFGTRRKSLEKFLRAGPPHVQERILPVEHKRTGFRAFYDKVIARGGEGLVVKHLGGGPGGGKRDDWYKVKPLNTVDYVCLGIGQTKLGSTFMDLGFRFGREFRSVAQVQVPSQFRGKEEGLVGRVIEIKGAEIFDSGVVRHGRFSRIRNDLRTDDCTLQAALAQRPRGDG